MSAAIALSRDVKPSARPWMRALGWGVLGLVFFLAALLVTLPAAQIAAWFRLPLAGVHGSVWQGSAQLRLPQVQLDQVDWRLGLGAPWSTPLVVHLHVSDNSLRAEGRVGLHWNGSLSLRGVHADMRLNHALLAQALPLPLDGQARFELPSAHWDKGLRQANELHMALEGLRLRMGEPLVLGSFAAQGGVQDGRLAITMRDTAGMLALEGGLKGDAASGLGFQAVASAKPGAPEALRDTLSLLPASPQGGAALQARLPAPWLARPDAGER